MNEQSMKSINLAFRFILEMFVLVAMFLLGLSASDEFVVGVVLGIIGVAIVMAIWGLFVAPKASRRLADPARLAVELVVWFIGALALGFSVSWLLAVMFGLAVLISLGLMFYWGQRGH
jgi:small-conductance mechanosensitive channel